MLQALIGPVTGLLDKFIPDADEKARIAHELATMSEKHAQQLALSQIEVNKAEAASGSIFKGGWRPAVGWVCAIAFAYHFILKDLITFSRRSLCTCLTHLLTTTSGYSSSLSLYVSV